MRTIRRRPPAGSRQVLAFIDRAPAPVSINRLTTVNYGDGGTQSYAFDNMGNRLTKVNNGTPEGYPYNAANMLLTRGGNAYTNDANGNTLTGGGRTNTWDSQNRLVQCAFNGTTTTSTYAAAALACAAFVVFLGCLQGVFPSSLLDGGFAWGFNVIGFIGGGNMASLNLIIMLGAQADAASDAAGGLARSAVYGAVGEAIATTAALAAIDSN